MCTKPCRPTRTRPHPSRSRRCACRRRLPRRRSSGHLSHLSRSDGRRSRSSRFLWQRLCCRRPMRCALPPTSPPFRFPRQPHRPRCNPSSRRRRSSSSSSSSSCLLWQCRRRSSRCDRSYFPRWQRRPRRWSRLPQSRCGPMRNRWTRPWRVTPARRTVVAPTEPPPRRRGLRPGAPRMRRRRP